MSEEREQWMYSGEAERGFANNKKSLHKIKYPFG